MKPIPIEQLELQRYPLTKDDSLRAWNAADEYLVSHIIQQILPNNKHIRNILICNDQFGAITCALSNFDPDFWTDSFLSKRAIRNNLDKNSLDKNDLADSKIIHISNRVSLRNTLPYDLVILRIPKHNSLLEYQLASLYPVINSKTIVVAGGMTKEIHNSTLSIFEKNIGTTKTSLARKKARLIFSSLEIKATRTNRPEYQIYKEQQFGVESYGLAGVFSRDSLDIGSRVLLNYLPKIERNQRVIDLGCGTGILGTTAAVLNPSIQVTFCDESYLAVESARLTYTKNIEKPRDKIIGRADFLVTDVLEGLKDDRFDHILCNPPFHQQNVQTLSIANKMFKQSAGKLRSSGELRIVANRHLKYRPMLNQYFRNVKIISDNPKFVVWLAKQPID